MTKRTTRKRHQKPPTSRGRGRPSQHTPELAQTICARLANGETLRRICADHKMPGRSTIARWLIRFHEFRDQYTRAREVQADILAEEIIDIADECRGRGAADVHRARLRCDSRKWFVSKVRPKVYGDRMAQELSGPDGAPIRTETAYQPLFPQEVAEAVAELLCEAEQQLGLPPDAKGPDAERMRTRLLESGPLPPAIYAALRQILKGKLESPASGTRGFEYPEQLFEHRHKRKQP
jgi:hypothetical protein